MPRKYRKTKGKPRPLCETCNKNPAKQKGRRKDGTRLWGIECGSCHKKRYKMAKKGQEYKFHKGDRCGTCGFVPIHPCQLDVDHIDGNHKNNSLDNLQTLCANCHRLKTYLNNDST